jgi:hypothetical protein
VTGRDVVIPGPPWVVVLDGTGDALGWEGALARRLCRTLALRGVALGVAEPVGVAEGIREAALAAGNCFVLLAHAEGAGPGAPARFEGLWRALAAALRERPAVLAAGVCAGFPAEPAALWRAAAAPGRILVVPTEALTPREAYAFLAKFLFELHLHGEAAITPMMARFCLRKAEKLAHGKVRVRA